MKQTYIKMRILEITAAIIINMLIGGFIYFNLSEASSSSEAKKAVRRMNFMIEAAYEESSEADEMNASKVDMKECSIVKVSGEWYMIFNLQEILNGNEKALEAVTDKISGLIPVSELNLENINLSGKEHAIFLRSSSSNSNAS